MDENLSQEIVADESPPQAGQPIGQDAPVEASAKANGLPEGQAGAQIGTHRSGTKAKSPQGRRFWERHAWKFALITALGTWAAVFADFLLEASDYPVSISDLGVGILASAFFISSLAAARFFERERRITDYEVTLRNLLISGLVVLSLSLVSTIYSFYTQDQRNLRYMVEDFWPLVTALSTILYLAASFAFLRRLIDDRTDSSRLAYTIFTGVLVLSAVSAVFEVPQIFLFSFYGVAAIAAISLLFRLRWIARLNSESRIYVLSYLFLLFWVGIGLSTQHVVQGAQGLFHQNELANVFPVLLLGFYVLYLLTSMLAVLFNWPISPVMDRRTAEIHDFQDLHRSIRGQVSADQIQEALFEMCFRNSNAAAGWLTRSVNGHRNVQFLKRGGISVEQISNWETDLIKAESALRVSSDNDTFLHCRNTAREDHLHTFAPGYQTLLSFPMSVNESDSGRIVLLKEQVDAFDAHEIRVLSTFVNQARLAIEKNRLVEDAVETERMRNDFEIAKKVQTALLPREVPTREWIDLCVEYSPAAEVGGDYYDFFEEGERIWAVIGDVSGKGMGAAFNVAELKGIFHSHRRLMTDPVEFLTETNTAVSACFDQGVFLTMIFMNFLPELNEFIYARAGHCPILHYQAHTKSAVYLEDSGLGLGILRHEGYRKHVQVNHRRYEANDLIILFTDGIFESVNAAGEEYGLERLREIVARHGYFNATEVKEKILQDVREFCVGGHVVDDITLMVIKFK